MKCHFALLCKSAVKWNCITDAIDYIICVDNRPLNLVEEKDFKHVMKQVARSYNVPSWETINNKIHVKYDKSTVIKKNLIDIKHFSLTTNIWSESMTNTCFWELGVI